jgi:hypothetical protein
MRKTTQRFTALVATVIAAAATLTTVALAGEPAGAATATSAVTWPSGVYSGSGAGTSSAKSFASYRGSSVSVAEVYPPRDTWQNFADDQYLIKQYSDFTGRLSLGIPLTIGNTTLSAIAAGNADKYFTTFAKNLNALGRGNSDLRVGWEFNGNWYPWSAYDPATYLAAFRHVSKLLKAALPNSTIDWNGNWGGSQCKHNPFTELYPGDSYVDVISLDAYDGGWVAANTDAKFTNWKDHDFSLQDWYDFAVNHGKKFAMAEWGLVADGEKDNPTFIKGMYNFFAAHASHIAYEAYFNSSGSSIYDPNKYPNSSTEYRGLWSKTTSSGTTTSTMTASAPSGPWNSTHALSVSGLAGGATGTVTFTTNGGALKVCSATVSGGKASCSGGASYRPGDHAIFASYPGDSKVAAASATTTLTVTKRAPGMVASVTSPSVKRGQSDTLAVRSLPGSATGKVSFSVGTTGMSLCSGSLVGGAAHCATSTSLRAGTYNVVAKWAGNTYYAAKSAKTTFVVTA